MSFHRHIQPFLLFFAIFGLWTICPDVRYKYFIRVFKVISVAIVLFLFSCVLFIDELHEFTSLSNHLGNFLFTFALMTHSFIIIESILNGDSQQQIINQLSSVDQLFGNRLKRIDFYRKEKHALLTRFTFFILMIFFPKVVQLGYLYSQNSAYKLMLPFMFIESIASLRLYQVLFFIHLVRNRLSSINEELKNMINVNDSAPEQDTHFDGRVSIFDRIRLLKQIYTELYDVSALLNILFGRTLLMILTKTFFDFASDCYWCLLQEQLDGIIFNGSCIIMSAILSGSLTFYCSSCAQYVSC